MNFARKLSVVFFLLFVACSQHRSKYFGNQIKITFGEYIKTLDTIPLPFTHSCADALFPKISLRFDSIGFEKYKDANCAAPLGVLFNDRTNIVIVDLSNGDYCKTPFLVSFDRQGNKLDSLNLYQNSFIDTAASSMPYFMIDKNKTIIVIDTSKKWKLDQSSKIIPGSETTSIDSTIYVLSAIGKFVKGVRKKL